MVHVSQTRFPADLCTAGTSVGNFYFAEDFLADLLSSTIFMFP